MNKKILLIEDDNFIREMYADELRKNGFEVSDYEKGEEGLEVLKNEEFDLLLLDIMLPGKNGLEILGEIKQDPKYKSLKVVLLTNLGQEAIIDQGFKLGALGYLIKSSYSPDQIVNEVKTFINSETK